MHQQQPQLSAQQQQHPPSGITASSGELVGSTSEHTFSNSVQTSQGNNLTTSSLMQAQDHSDHHIVNPSSSSLSSMTDRHRPIDKNNQHNSFNDGLLEQGQKQNHYEFVNSGSNLNSSTTHVQYDPSYTLPQQHSVAGGLTTNPLDSSDQTTASSSIATNFNISDGQSSVTPVINEANSTNMNNNIHNNDNDSGLVTPTFSNYDQSKPVVLIEPALHNESVNYPTYPLLVSSFSPHQQAPVSENHFSTLGPIDEIHGLSVTTTKDSSNVEFSSSGSQSSAMMPAEGYNQQASQTSDQRPFYPDSGSSTSDQRQKPSNQHVNLNLGGQTTPPGSIWIGNIDAPSQPTPATSFMPSTISTLHNEPVTLPPPTTTTQTPPKFFGDSNNKKGGNKEVACGVTASYPQTKVVGGKNAAFGAWPWQVSVRKVSFFGFSSTHRCGGAVISSEWIATAGHCVEDLALQSIRIRVGEYDFSSMSEPFPYIERAARRKVVHPKYNFYTYENDLALVQLDQPIQFPPHVAPICLPPDNIELLGRNATVTGWGRLNEGGTLPTILQEVRVPIVSNDKCKDMFLSAGRPEYIPDIFLCAGYEEGGRDSCQGDSGGPLQVKGDDGKWFLAGIISWGIGCAEQNLPGVCTRISRFKLWIQSTMNSGI